MFPTNIKHLPCNGNYGNDVILPLSSVIWEMNIKRINKAE